MQERFPDPPRDDLIQPFTVSPLHLSGRLVRMGETIDTVLDQHDYPEPVSIMLGELLAFASAIGGSLKFDGRFTVETRGDGPIRLLAVDFSSDGRMRGYASYDEERVAEAIDAGAPDNSVPHLLGEGVMALTVDQGRHTELYQGLVPLEGATLADCAHLYFRQSDQVDSIVKLAVARFGDGWRAGGIAVQRLAELGPGDEAITGEDREEEWRRAVALVSSATSREMTDPEVPHEALLYRLFHEDGVRVTEPRPLSFGCGCTERARAMLENMNKDQAADLVENGRIVVTCQFCNRTQVFDTEELSAMGIET